MQDGWVARLFQEHPEAAAGLRRGLTADGLVLGGPAGALAGPGTQDPDPAEPRSLPAPGRRPARTARRPPPTRRWDTSSGYAGRFTRRQGRSRPTWRPPGRRRTTSPRAPFGRQLALAAQLIRAGPCRSPPSRPAKAATTPTPARPRPTRGSWASWPTPWQRYAAPSWRAATGTGCWS